MPELPEAETIVRDLQNKIVGKTVIAIRVFKRDILGNTNPRAFQRTLEQRRIESVTRRAKKVVIQFDHDVILAISLGMTGRVVVSTARR
ncbi:MAG TPA: DNA-formamidopyrimidine glycosylase family protein, partial [Longimicrobiales bacterium]